MLQSPLQRNCRADLRIHLSEVSCEVRAVAANDERGRESEVPRVRIDQDRAIAERLRGRVGQRKGFEGRRADLRAMRGPAGIVLDVILGANAVVSGAPGLPMTCREMLRCLWFAPASCPSEMRSQRTQREYRDHRGITEARSYLGADLRVLIFLCDLRADRACEKLATSRANARPTERGQRLSAPPSPGLLCCREGFQLA